ncbi:hypothetical protein HLH44_05570 [Gluconacetobacter sp. 1c LMG 22058]|uniref:Transposase IS701-like DDE domain-containing protein n=1 Tax=Gluconacetobacter dulcium TaxID=2729096 RepID=A0A7W4JYH3_9PROT|nr:hypothetical protein [Gluconacetobacter dulcium]MBB2196937.1 hypothetical protein [Gluconacetobacter dulcium]
MLLAPLSWTGRVWGLPFLTVLCPSERYARERGRPHRKLTDRARQGLLLVARWLPGRRIIAVTDSSYASIDLLDAVRDRVCMVSRLRLYARLFDPPSPRTARTLGRPRQTGERQPSLANRLENPAIQWSEAAIGAWYGGQEYRVEFISGTALWHHPGRAVPIRSVLVRDPAERFRPQAFLRTDLTASPVDILAWFVRRWSMEVTFAVNKAPSRHRDPTPVVGSGHRSYRTGPDGAFLRHHSRRKRPAKTGTCPASSNSPEAASAHQGHAATQTSRRTRGARPPSIGASEKAPDPFLRPARHLPAGPVRQRRPRPRHGTRLIHPARPAAQTPTRLTHRLAMGRMNLCRCQFDPIGPFGRSGPCLFLDG